MNDSEVTNNCFTMGSLYKYARTPDEIKFFHELELFDKTRSFTLCSIVFNITFSWSSYISHDFLTKHISVLTFVNRKEYRNAKIYITQSSPTRILNTLHILMGLVKKRNKRIFRKTIKLYLAIMDWFKETMEKSYAPNGPGYIRIANTTLVGK